MSSVGLSNVIPGLRWINLPKCERLFDGFGSRNPLIDVMVKIVDGDAFKVYRASRFVLIPCSGAVRVTRRQFPALLKEFVVPGPTSRQPTL